MGCGGWASPWENPLPDHSVPQYTELWKRRGLEARVTPETRPTPGGLSFPFILKTYTSLTLQHSNDMPRDSQRSKSHYPSSFVWGWLSYCSSILHRCLPSPSRQTPLNFNIHPGYAELHSNPTAPSRCYQLGAMDVVRSPRHGPGQPALDGPARAGGWTRQPPEVPASLSLSLSGSMMCHAPMMENTTEASNTFSCTGSVTSGGEVWEFAEMCLGAPFKKHTENHLRFLVPCTLFPSLSEIAACCQSLPSCFTLDYWLLWCTSSHVLLFSREHHQNSENKLFWFGVSLQLQKTRKKLSYTG